MNYFSLEDTFIAPFGCRLYLSVKEIINPVYSKKVDETRGTTPTKAKFKRKEVVSAPTREPCSQVK